jgi:hypothetical protein
LEINTHHRLDGEQISINVRAVFLRDSQPILRPRKIARRATATLGNSLSCSGYASSAGSTAEPSRGEEISNGR